VELFVVPQPSLAELQRRAVLPHRGEGHVALRAAPGRGEAQGEAVGAHGGHDQGTVILEAFL